MTSLIVPMVVVVEVDGVCVCVERSAT
jgi:hypothetical protein